MRGFFRRFTHPLGKIDPWLANGRLRPARVRAYAPGDLERCLDLYRLNEPGRFPPNQLLDFEATLRHGSYLFLVIEDNEGPLRACGGIEIQRRTASEGVVLCYGLVDPQWHRHGIGTTLLLARLALLPERAWQVFLNAIQSSQSFYERFGFIPHQTWTLESGENTSVLSGHLTPADRSLCRVLLMNANVELPPDDLKIPVFQIEE